VTYSKVLGRRILLLFLIFTIVFSIAALISRHNIADKLADISKSASNFEQGQSTPERSLLLLHQAEDDFQESLLKVNNKKIFDYKNKLSLAFGELDTLLKERINLPQSNFPKNNPVKVWYKKKIELSTELYTLKHSFDSLLTVYADFQNKTNEDSIGQRSYSPNIHQPSITSDTIRKPIKKEGFLKRLKDAVSGKNNNSIVEINHNSQHVVSINNQKAIKADRLNYLQKLKQLQQRNQKLLAMQKQLNILNIHISNELENIISEAKDLGFNISNSFKVMALQNYQEATQVLNSFYLAALFLILAFAISLIGFIIQINKSELALRKENEQSLLSAQQKADELIKNIVLSTSTQSPSKVDALAEIVQLAVNNNPAFLMKFNEFDSEFIKNLLSISPNLIATEIEFCILLKLNFETKEIARHTKASVRSVEGKKYRIRKKLAIPAEMDINIWMANLK
jgi:hypothetical protein